MSASAFRSEYVPTSPDFLAVDQNTFSFYGQNTIKLPKENLEQSGIYYFILKQLAWADISLQEVISTTNEMTIVVKEEDINI